MPGLSDRRGILPVMVAPQRRCLIAASHGDGEGEGVTPLAGTMVPVPSWLIRAVAPVTGPGAGILVAFIPVGCEVALA